MRPFCPSLIDQSDTLGVSGMSKPLSKSHRLSRLLSKESFLGHVFALPFFIGFFCFTIGPMVASLYMSFTDYNIISSPQWIGCDNYVNMFTNDKQFWISLYNTAYYAFFSVGLSLIVGLAIALLLNQELRGISAFRTIFYIPAVTGGAATAMLWWWILHPTAGILNIFLSKIGISGPAWLNDPTWAKPALILIAIWGSGRSMIIWLAGLQGIPESLYEAARIDGANFWHAFWNITIPMLSPTILFNLIMGVIQALQVFQVAYILQPEDLGGPVNSTLFYAVYLYKVAFKWTNMGYASALAWVLFIIILLLTLLNLAFSGRWVYYEGIVR